MKTCEGCGRDLEEDEKDYCPACKSTKSHKKKRWWEIIGGALIVIVITVLKGGKGGGKG